LGLIDEIGDVETVIKDKFADYEIEDFSKLSKFEEFMDKTNNSA